MPLLVERFRFCHQSEKKNISEALLLRLVKVRFAILQSRSTGKGSILEWPAMPAPPRLYAGKLGRNGAIPRFILIINANFSCATYWWMASQTSDI